MPPRGRRPGASPGAGRRTVRAPAPSRDGASRCPRERRRRRSRGRTRRRRTPVPAKGRRRRTATSSSRSCSTTALLRTHPKASSRRTVSSPAASRSPKNGNGFDVLGEAGVSVRSDAGLICGLNGYPKTECAPAVTSSPSPTAKPSPTKPSASPYSVQVALLGGAGSLGEFLRHSNTFAHSDSLPSRRPTSRRPSHRADQPTPTTAPVGSSSALAIGGTRLDVGVTVRRRCRGGAVTRRRRRRQQPPTAAARRGRSSSAERSSCSSSAPPDCGPGGTDETPPPAAPRCLVAVGLGAGHRGEPDDAALVAGTGDCGHGVRRRSTTYGRTLGADLSIRAPPRRPRHRDPDGVRGRVRHGRRHARPLHAAVRAVAGLDGRGHDRRPGVGRGPGAGVRRGTPDRGRHRLHRCGVVAREPDPDAREHAGGAVRGRA